MGKRGQTTIFIIVAIVIVVGVILIYLLFPNSLSFIGSDISPHSFLSSCIEDELHSDIDMLSKQGGYSNPEGFVLYQGNKVKYLCYSANYYLPCNVQQPRIKAHFENELNKLIKTKGEECVGELKELYEKKGYKVSSASDVNVSVEIVPSRIKINFKAPMSITKDTTQTFREIESEIDSEMYNLLMLSTSIIDFEATYGDAETNLYIQYYPNLKMNKMKLSDGTTVYTLGDVRTDETFMFASRSNAFPPGYGMEA